MEWAGPGSAPSKCWARQRLGGEACVNGAGPRTWAGPGGAVSEAKCGRGRGGAGPEAGLRRAAGLSLRSLAAPLGPHVQKAELAGHAWHCALLPFGQISLESDFHFS